VHRTGIEPTRGNSSVLNRYKVKQLVNSCSQCPWDFHDWFLYCQESNSI